MNLMAILVTGLLAGGVSCAAVQGGLLTGLVARQHKGVRPASAAMSRDHGQGRAAGTDRPALGTSRLRLGRLADDLSPVGGFLAGKLVSHTILGALLGGVGTAVELSAHTRALVQLLAGALIVCSVSPSSGCPGSRAS
ncbi:uncharacterized protein (Precursor) [Nocardioides sp. PD653]|nr:uncharacterized protein (Precursor) [Nocardioides sp. PD653-B2]GAW56515.1 uncharacterized protein (Precursor) [Nocardioides sp. PD653]